MKKIISCALVLSIILVTLCSCSKQKERFTETYLEYFDTASLIVGYEYDIEKFEDNCLFIEQQLKEYNQLYDIYKTYENINNIRTINKNAGVMPVKVDIRIIELLEYCKEMYTLTNGTVNVAMGSVLSIWHDYRTMAENKPAEAEVPPMDMLLDASKHTNINNVIIDKENSTVFLTDPNMSLDVGAIAKGYATERIAKALIEKGIENYTLNIGGNIRTIGTKGDGAPWITGVENPIKTSDKAFVLRVELNNHVFVTSGTYQRFYTVDGVRYHHIINPKTLMPENNYLSVSILCGDSGLADALSTAVFNMSFDDGKAFIESLDGVEAMWVFDEDDVKYTDGFKNYIYE